VKGKLRSRAPIAAAGAIGLVVVVSRGTRALARMLRR